MNRGCFALPLAFLLLGCSAQVTQRVTFQAGGGAFTEISAPVTSFEERRFATVVRQQYDFSCGSAALATLLVNHYGVHTSEAAVFNGMWKAGDRQQITKLGFSLLDMKRYLSDRGLSADGYKVNLDQIAKAGVPGIALIAIKGYRHFVVVKGINDQELLVGDPSLGLRVMSRDEFQRAWNGIYFIIGGDPTRGKRNFNLDAQWAAFSRAPVGGVFLDPLSQQALSLTAPFFRDF